MLKLTQPINDNNQQLHKHCTAMGDLAHHAMLVASSEATYRHAAALASYWFTRLNTMVRFFLCCGGGEGRGGWEDYE